MLLLFFRHRAPLVQTFLKRFQLFTFLSLSVSLVSGMCITVLRKHQCAEVVLARDTGPLRAVGLARTLDGGAVLYT